QKVYNYMEDRPPIESVGTARRDILKRDLYNYKGIQMVDLVHASRGCRFHCYPCAVAYLGGRKFRPRPIEKAIEEMAGIDNNRLFIVDNSLAQDTQWEMDLFREMIPLKKSWCCHPIEDKPEVLDLAAQAGAWYVYQAVFDTSDLIRDRVRRYHDHGIGVEGTILLGLDHHTEDFIKRLIDFLLEIDLDLAEFTVLTPFPHTKVHDDLKKQGRIFSDDWNDYSADTVVYHPKQMSAEKLQGLLDYAWNTFYQDEPQEVKMFKLFQQVVEREMANNTFRPRNRNLASRAFGREV
ncbi:MAG: radical SAM protein, partial [Deltaproteobacteria bacterium]|nr:radical SAM protein [Deltaproteobacteria bacterium]